MWLKNWFCQNFILSVELLDRILIFVCLVHLSLKSCPIYVQQWGSLLRSFSYLKLSPPLSSAILHCFSLSFYNWCITIFNCFFQWFSSLNHVMNFILSVFLYRFPLKTWWYYLYKNDESQNYPFLFFLKKVFFDWITQIYFTIWKWRFLYHLC